MFCRLHKKGNLGDFIFTNLFTLLVAVLVLALFLVKTADIGSSSSFEKKFIAADLGLAVDSVYAVRPDVNLYLKYPVPVSYGVKLEDRKVNVYSNDPKDSESFWFSGDPLIFFTPGEMLPASKDRNILIARRGNSLGVVDKLPNMVEPFCPNLTGKFKGKIDYAELADLGSRTVKAVSGDFSLLVSLSQSSSPVVVLYVADNSESKNFACLIAQGLVKEFPSVEGVAIIPANPLLFSKDAPQRMLSRKDSTVVAELSLPVVNSEVRNKVGNALRGVLS